MRIILPPFEEKIRAEIRDELAKSQRLASTSFKNGCKTHSAATSVYDVRKLVGKVRNEALLRIVYWTPADHQDGMPKPLACDHVEAAKSVVADGLNLSAYN